MASVYLGLVHYPIYNKNRDIITTAVTNFDIHDIARTSRTYGLQRYLVINPNQGQTALVGEILAYWRNGYGKQYNPDRYEALGIVETVADINQAINLIYETEGIKPLVVSTDAKKYKNSVSYQQLREIIEKETAPVLVLFGTGWGIEKTTLEQFDYILEPIRGTNDYNHLPVRAAAAIILDRLLGEKWWSGK